MKPIITTVLMLVRKAIDKARNVILRKTGNNRRFNPEFFPDNTNIKSQSRS